MKKIKALISIALAALMLLGMTATAFAADELNYTIVNPYESVTSLLGESKNHYRTNLHTHTTASDASVDLASMVKGYYDEGFDILALADHGVIGKDWNVKPTQIPLYLYQYIIGKKVTKLTDDEYKAIKDGTYPSENRTNGRGMQCVPTGIELNMLTITKSHVNGYFSDFGEGDIGFENGYEYAVKNVEKSGGISYINHPGDLLRSSRFPERAKDPANVRWLGNIFNNYKTCLGMEVFNHLDSVTRNDRVLWDEILQYVIPRGERNVWGFSNSDAHVLSDIDTSFMDFILPEYTIDNFKNAMINGTFFAIGRRARGELGNDFVGTGAYPTVTSIKVDEVNDTITVTGKDTEKIQWISNGNVILESTETNEKGEVVSTIKLREHSDSITCYVRFQLLGKGGACLAQPFICNAGNMARFIINDPRTKAQKIFDSIVFNLKSTRLYVIIEAIYYAVA